MFDGVTFNARIGDDDGIRVNPDKKKVPDDDTRQNCVLQTIADEKEEWQWGFAGPKWAATFTLNLGWPMNDHNHYFGEGSAPGREWKSYSIQGDTHVSDWRHR
jgi:hypothetical protein